VALLPHCAAASVAQGVQPAAAFYHGDGGAVAVRTRLRRCGASAGLIIALRVPLALAPGLRARPPGTSQALVLPLVALP
jgi:hypothetical protein